MHLRYVPQAWPLAAAAVVTAGLAIYALRRRQIRGALPFGLCMLFTAVWAGGYALEIAATDSATGQFWMRVQSVAYSFNPVLWLLMVFLFVERDQWVTRRNVLLLLILPLLTVALAWSNQLHGLMWSEVSLDSNGAFPLLNKSFGPWFWVILVHSYALNLLSELLLALSLRRKSALYREQSWALFIGLALLFLQNALYVFGIQVWSRYDLTPATAGVSGLIIAWGIFRYRLFDIVPVARENIIEQMADGLIVLDANNRIADMNLTAKAIFGSSPAGAIGQGVAGLFRDWPELARNGPGREAACQGLIVQCQGGQRVFEVSHLSWRDRKGRQNGWTIILHDVTEQRLAQSQLLEQQRALAMAEERERLARDLHDNLGQIFGIINVQAQAIKHVLHSAGVDLAAGQLSQLVDLAQSAHQEMRAYVRSARRTAVETRDFVAAVKQEVEQFSRQTGINVKLQLADEPALEQLDLNANLQLAYIAKEALNNIRKHAAAQQVSIELATVDDELRILIADDGRGFDPTGGQSVAGLGLGIMRERAAAIGAHLWLESAPGMGTRVCLRMPRPEGVNASASATGG